MWLSNQRLTLPPWNTKTSADPAAVSPHVSSVPIRDCTIGWYPLNILTICIQCNNGFRTRPRSTEGLVPRLTAAAICTGWDGQDWPVSIGKGQLLLDCLDAFSGLWSIIIWAVLYPLWVCLVVSYPVSTRIGVWLWDYWLVTVLVLLLAQSFLRNSCKHSVAAADTW